MHVQPDKVTISKQETHRIADLYMMNNSTHDSNPGKNTHLATKPIPDTYHHPVNHRPRQLSGRHH